MKQIAFTFFLTSLLYTSLSFSQTGTDCANADTITSLPYIVTGLTTAGSGNDYNDLSACGSVYMTGEDYIFVYIPVADIDISVILSNTGVGTGVFITDKCPDDPTANCLAANEAQNGNPQLNGVHLLKDSTYFIIVSTYDLFNLNQNTVFDIEVRESFPLDVGVYTLWYPRSSCAIIPNIDVYIKNFGTDTVFTFDVAYTIDGAPPVVETFSDTIIPGGEGNFPFNTHPDMSIIDHSYYLEVYTLLPGDGNLANDTLKRYITHTSSISTFPYYEDFESGSGGWAADWRNLSGSEFSWELGQPNATIIDTAHSGTNAWVTNLSGNTNINENSFVISPCFDFSTLTQPILDLWIWYEAQTSDYIKIDYSLDSSYSWHQLGTISSGVNWYNTPSGYAYEGWHESSGGWINAIHNCYNLGGEPQVQFRITFDGGVNGTAEGFAFDDIRIYEAPVNDLAIISILYPYDNCGLTAGDSVTIKFTNTGLYKQVDFDLSYSIDGGTTFITELYSDTIFPLDTVIYTFTATANLSGTGLYSIVAATGLSTDDNINNDSITKPVYHYSTIDVFPYKEDFETDDGTWYSTGYLSSWQYGIPADSIINHAASGNYAWVTNLSGVANMGEKSYLYTPCFDLSNLTKPKVNINIWYDIEPIGIRFEYSVDNGQTWNNYGDTTGNWYNQGYNWIHQSNGWVNVERDLYGFAGIPQIQFRFNFTGTDQYSGFAVDDFTICDEPASGFSYQTNGLEVSFTDESAASNTYYWDFGDSTTSTLQNPVHIYNYPDTFTVMQIVYSDCGTDTSFGTISLVGINTVHKGSFNVFPNPADIEIYVQFDEKQTKDFTIEIINLQGETVVSKSFRKITGKTIKIPLNNIAGGLYFMNIRTESGTYSRKISIN